MCLSIEQEVDARLLQELVESKSWWQNCECFFVTIGMQVKLKKLISTRVLAKKEAEQKNVREGKPTREQRKHLTSIENRCLLSR